MHHSFLILARLAAVAIFWMAFLNTANSQNLHRQMEDLRQMAPFDSLSLLAPLDPRSLPAPESLPPGARCFALDHAVFYDFWEKMPNAFSLRLESAEVGSLELNLARVALEGEGFEVREAGATRNALPYVSGAHYRGALAGEDGSVVALSIFADGTVMGLIVGAEGVWVLGPLERDPAQRLVLYRSDALPQPHPFVCSADMTQHADASEIEPEASDRNSSCKTVAVYLECDYKLYQDRGANTTAAVNYVSGLFNQTAALFANDQINVSIAQIQVWTSPDPYVGMGSTAAVLNAFRTNKGVNFPGQLAHFLTTRNIGGGIAYLDVICSKQFAFGVSAIANTYQNVPTYSWSVEVLTHELGHNLGAWHTQSCNWPGGPIDNCVQPEGNCAPGPTPVNGGTIMSYCHLTPIGINFNHGFGPLPRNRMQARIAASPCVNASANANAPANLQSANVGPTSAALSWGAVPGAANYTVQFQALGSQVWLTAATVSVPAYTLGNLNPLTTYNWRVKSDCSAYSAVASFTTTQQSGGGGSNCQSPQTLTTLSIGNTSAAVQWSASPGATSYTVQYKRANVSAWTTAGNTFSLSFNLTGLSANTSYHWRVKANCSDYSKIGYFTTSGNSNPVQCAIPGGLSNLRVNPTNALIAWLATPGASNYTLQIKKGANGAYQTLGTVPVTKVSISGLQPGTTYYWRVKANCSPGFSPALLLQTPSMLQSDSDALPTDDAPGVCALWPNPAHEVLHWRWTAADPEPTRLQIFDTAGRLWYDQAFDGDYHTADITALPAGIYVARALRGDTAAVRTWAKGR